jgi:hypothetical protein
MPFDNPRPGPLTDIEILVGCAKSDRQPELLAEGPLQEITPALPHRRTGVACNNPQFDEPSRTGRRMTLAMARQLPRGWGRLQRMICFRPRKRLIRFNDNPRMTHDDVMALFDRTIQHLGSAHTYVHR